MKKDAINAKDQDYIFIKNPNNVFIVMGKIVLDVKI